MFLEEPPPVGTRLGLCLQVNDVGVLTSGVVVYSHDGLGAGIHFFDLSKEEEARIQGLLDAIPALFHEL